MKVSIIIPVYNVASYISRCLQSVEAQTYQDIECILIDDCGTDQSIKIAEEFISDHKGKMTFNIIHHQHNQGLSTARNTGIKAATGDYIYFMDSDDAVTPHCIEILTDLAKMYPDADYVQGNIVKGPGLMEGEIDNGVSEYCNNKEILEEIILNKTHRTAWNRLMKRLFITSNKLFFPEGLIMEDHYWTYFVSKYARAVAFTHQETYYYYNNQNSIVNTMSKQQLIKKYTSYMTITDVISNDLLMQDHIQPCYKKYLAETIYFCMINVSHLHSLHHWFKLWRFTCSLAYKLRLTTTYRQVILLICMLPPFCFMAGIKGWQWRLRQYVIGK